MSLLCPPPPFSLSLLMHQRLLFLPQDNKTSERESDSGVRMERDQTKGRSGDPQRQNGNQGQHRKTNHRDGCFVEDRGSWGSVLGPGGLSDAMSREHLEREAQIPSTRRHKEEERGDEGRERTKSEWPQENKNDPNQRNQDEDENEWPDKKEEGEEGEEGGRRSLDEGGERDPSSWIFDDRETETERGKE